MGNLKSKNCFRGKFPVFWLHDNDKSADAFNHQTLQRSFSTFEHYNNHCQTIIDIKEINDKIHIIWESGKKR